MSSAAVRTPRVDKGETLRAAADLIREPYLLDPGALEFLVEDVLRLGSDAPVALMKTVFETAGKRREFLGEFERKNLGQFIRRAAEEPSVRRALERSLKKKGRCPRSEHSWLRQHLKPPVPTIIALPQHATTPGHVETLDWSDTTGSVSDFHTLLDRMGQLSRGPRFLDVRLGGFIYASALAVLAQWILANQLVGHYELTCPPETFRYLENLGFKRALRDSQIVISPDPMDWAVGLTRINRDLPTERVTEKIVDILHTFVNPSQRDREVLLVLISEMIENIHRHADAPVDGFAVAQVYPKRLKMGITLVDAGMGVRASFEEGSPSVPIGHLRTDGDFLLEAVKLHVTSKSSRHSGYGLYLLSEVIARNRGTFLLTSGSATIVGYRRGGRIAFDTYAHRPWKGTIVSVIIDLNHELPLSEVYGEMPLLPGMEGDDIFI